MNGKYMVHIGFYPHTGKAGGIAVYGADVEKGALKERCEVKADNSSYVVASSDGKTLYSIADEGVVSLYILRNGSLARLNSSPVRGMRGYHLCTNAKDEYTFVSGYHGGKTIVLNLGKDGSVGETVDEIYNKDYDSVAERDFRSRVICARKMSDGRYILSVDNGVDQVEVYWFNDKDKELVQVDAIHCDLESVPGHFRHSSDGRFLYLVYELQSVISVCSYETGDRVPVIEKTQTISIMATKNPGNPTAACAMRLSLDEKYIYCANVGESTVMIYRRDEESGLLTMISYLPVGGEYPKGVAILPDQRHTVSINRDSGSISFLEVSYEKGLLVICGRSVSVNQPNCYAIARIDRSQQGMWWGYIIRRTIRVYYQNIEYCEQNKYGYDVEAG